MINIISLSIWISACLMGAIVAVLLIGLIYERFQSTPTITTVETYNYPIWNVKFPAVTICNINKVHRPASLKIRSKLYVKLSSPFLSTFIAFFLSFFSFVVTLIFYFCFCFKRIYKNLNFYKIQNFERSSRRTGRSLSRSTFQVSRCRICGRSVRENPCFAAGNELH